MTRKQRRTRAEAARANGAKSQGPVTPEGKARSAQSGLHHGAFAQTILLQTESPAAFDRLVNDYITDFQPENESQLKIVYRLAAATWRQQRAEGVEASMVNEKMQQQHPALAQQYNSQKIDPTVRTTVAISDLYSDDAGRLKAVQNAIDLCQRQFSRALRDLDRAKKMNTEPATGFRVPKTEPQPEPAAQPEPDPEPQTQPESTPEPQKTQPEPKRQPTPAPSAQNPQDRRREILDRVAAQRIDLPRMP